MISSEEKHLCGESFRYKGCVGKIGASDFRNASGSALFLDTIDCCQCLGTEACI